MILNIAKYLIIIILLASCGNQAKELIEYGFKEKGSDSLNAALRISDLEQYGKFTDRLLEITCNDSVPQIILESKNTIRSIYPIEYCEVPMFHPRDRNTFYIHKDSIFKNNRKIHSSDLSKLMMRNFENNGKKADFAESPEKVLFIFEYYEQNGVDGIEKHLDIITKSFDSIKTNNELKIIFWPKFNSVPIFENGQLKYNQPE